MFCADQIGLLCIVRSQAAPDGLSHSGFANNGLRVEEWAGVVALVVIDVFIYIG